MQFHLPVKLVDIFSLSLCKNSHASMFSRFTNVWLRFRCCFRDNIFASLQLKEDLARLLIGFHQTASYVCRPNLLLCVAVDNGGRRVFGQNRDDMHSLCHWSIVLWRHVWRDRRSAMHPVACSLYSRCLVTVGREDLPGERCAAGARFASANPRRPL